MLLCVLKIRLRFTSNSVVHFICAVIINYSLTSPRNCSYFVEIVKMRDTVWRSCRYDIIFLTFIYMLWACHWIGSTCSHTACGCLSHTLGCSFIWYPASLAANLVEISCIFQSSLVICRHVSFEKPNLPVICRVALFDLCWQVCHLFAPLFLCILWRDGLNAHSLQLKFSHIWIKKASHLSVVKPWNCHWKAVLQS